MPQANFAKSSQVGLFQCVPLGVPAKTEQTLCRLDQQSLINQLLGVKEVVAIAISVVTSAFSFTSKSLACCSIFMRGF